MKERSLFLIRLCQYWSMCTLFDSIYFCQEKYFVEVYKIQFSLFVIASQGLFKHFQINKAQEALFLNWQ